MAYIRMTDLLYPVYEDQIRMEYNNTSFPTPFVPPEEYESVFPSPTPVYNQLTQVVFEAAPVQNQGLWMQAWEVRDLPPDVAAKNMAEAALREAANAFVQEVKTDTLLAALMISTAPEIEDLIDKTNHRDALRSLALAVGLLLRERFP